MLDLNLIRIDGGTQTRAELNQDTVDTYAEAIAAGVLFPPVTVFFDGKDRWLADGFHRYFAAKKAGKPSILENIIPGTKRDAVLFSLGANGTHGLTRTNADKRNAVETMLQDLEWAAWSDRKIAEACGVSVPFVSAIRRPEVAEKQKENRAKASAKDTPPCNPITPTPAAAQAAAEPAPKPTKPAPAVVEPEIEAPPEYTELDAAQDQISDLQDALAVATMGDVSDEDKTQAATLIAELRARVKTLEATLKAVTTSRDTYMNENAELRKQITRQRKEIDKATGRRTA